MKITMLLSNGFGPDPRVAAEAVALQSAGHQVTIFAWDRTGSMPEQEEYQGVKVIRSQIRTTYSRGPMQVCCFLKFWQECRSFLQKNPTQAIHCHDLDTLWPGVAEGRLQKVPIIFDAHEAYPDMVAHLFPRPMVAAIRLLEKRLVPQTTAVITVGQILARRFERLKARRVVVVGNYKKHLWDKPSEAPDCPPLRIIYVGGLNRDRLLAPLIMAIAGTTRYQLLIVGDGLERAKLEELAAGADNIQFTGFLPQERAREFINLSHLVYYGVAAEYPNNQYSTPNSLFLAMTAGRPMLTTAVGEIATIVQAEHCGTVLSDLHKDEIVKALERYYDPVFWKEHSRNGFQASLTKYNWEKASQNLISLYRELECNHGQG
ncbi:glycosyltransferase involved in cell wall biosynthesis [Hydrogenispora ethanolica]|uniref:Glycosyltransferase involved in cell wall biosynthesis n=1 Tax=Hydrogenispora ethanolica TaxID=1082276 RepID=A0A4R1R8D7_HYDET|nr:glycosyltransferase [Hydrogenispora ethanolica]TCL61810.1 glycosyltransferase involved in cell wall biosynthesis [Hydrogenispora ethanolica]